MLPINEQCRCRYPKVEPSMNNASADVMQERVVDNEQYKCRYPKKGIPQ